LKKSVLLIIVIILVLGVVLSGCRPILFTIAVVGPLSSGIEGQHMLWSARLARDTINGPGITIGSNTYDIKLLEVDTARYSDPAAAVSDAISRGAQFIIGGWQSGDVAAMIPVAMANHVPFFIDGTPKCSLLSGTADYNNAAHAGTPYYPYETSSTDYKYIFRGAPLNGVFLVNNAFMMLTMVAKRIEGIIGANETNPVRIAIFAENLAWADPIVWAAEELIPKFGWELGPVKRVSDTAKAAVVSAALTEIKEANCHAIFTIMSGPVGVIFGTQKGALEIPAIAVGINLKAQYPDYWDATEYDTGKYGAEYEITLATWALNVTQTNLTASFLNGFLTWPANTDGEVPIFTAASYDIIYDLVAAIQNVGSATATNQIIAWLENSSKGVVTTTGLTIYYPPWDGTTMGTWWGLPGTWPALNSIQRDDYYNSASHLIGYNPACNFTMPPYTTHDLVYGPTWETGIGIQWQNVSGTGTQVGVWPNDEHWTDQNTMSRAFAGINWNDSQYAGITDFVIPDEYCVCWTGSPC